MKIHLAWQSEGLPPNQEEDKWDEPEENDEERTQGACKEGEWAREKKHSLGFVLTLLSHDLLPFPPYRVKTHCGALVFLDFWTLFEVFW